MRQLCCVQLFVCLFVLFFWGFVMRCDFLLCGCGLMGPPDIMAVEAWKSMPTWLKAIALTGGGTELFPFLSFPFLSPHNHTITQSHTFTRTRVSFFLSFVAINVLWGPCVSYPLLAVVFMLPPPVSGNSLCCKGSLREDDRKERGRQRGAHHWRRRRHRPPHGTEVRETRRPAGVVGHQP